MSLSAKSGASDDDVKSGRTIPVPRHLRDGHYAGAAKLGQAVGYQYAHDVEGRVADMECLPPSLASRRYYHPTQEGREKLLAQRMEEIRRIRAGKRGGS